MAISLVRVDDRLIHGQVVEGWVRRIKSTCLIVASDEVAHNIIRKTVMEMAVPAKVKVVIDEVANVVKRIKSREFDQEEVIVLFANPDDILKAVEMGFDCPRLNIGGLHYRPGTKQVMDALCLEKSDVEVFSRLVARGVDVYFQPLPDEHPTGIMQIINNPGCAIF